MYVYIMLSLSTNPSGGTEGASVPLAVGYNAAFNMGGLLSFQVNIFVVFRRIPRSGVAGS